MNNKNRIKMKKRTLATLAFGGLLIIGSSLSLPKQSYAREAVCDHKDKMIEKLEREYSEKRSWVGLSVDGELLEIFESESGSWTLISTYPEGMSCYQISGYHTWKKISPLSIRDKIKIRELNFHNNEDYFQKE